LARIAEAKDFLLTGNISLSFVPQQKALEKTKELTKKTQIISESQYEGDLTSNAAGFDLKWGADCDLTSNISQSFVYQQKALEKAKKLTEKTQIISESQYEGDLTSNAAGFDLKWGADCDLTSNISQSFVYQQKALEKANKLTSIEEELNQSKEKDISKSFAYQQFQKKAKENAKKLMT